MKCYFRKLQGGTLVPANEETAEFIQKKKVGAVLGGQFAETRNYKFLQKTMTLFKYCFDHFAENMEGAHLEYRGVKAAPSFDYFRKNMIILAGHYTATYDIFGKLHLEAKSLSYANCSEEEAERIYSDVINVALKHVYRQSLSEDELRKIVDDLLRYA